MSLSYYLLLTLAAQASPDLDARIGVLFNAADGLTAARVADRAAQASWDVRAAQAQLAAAQAEVERAWVAYYPRLSLSARYVRLSDQEATPLGNLVVAAAPGPVTAATALTAQPLAFPVILDQVTFQASLTVPITDYLLRLPQARGAAEAGAAAARAGAAVAEQRTRAEARLVYYAWLRARLQRLVADQALEQATLHASDARAAEAAGTAFEADRVAAEARVANAELFVLRAQNLADRLAEQLRLALRDPDGTGYSVGEDVRAEVPADLELRPLGALREEAHAHRPELRALDEQLAAARRQRALTRASYYPRVDAFADVALANPNSRRFPQTAEFSGSWDVGAQVSFSPNDLWSALQASDGVAAQEAELEAQRSRLLDAIDAEVLQVTIEAREARAAIGASLHSLSAAAEAHRVRRAMFQAGLAKSVEVTDAETALTQARLEVINARIDLRASLTKLDRALGRATDGAPRS